MRAHFLRVRATHEPFEAPPGFGLRQSSGALVARVRAAVRTGIESAVARLVGKRQRTAAVQNAIARSEDMGSGLAIIGVGRRRHPSGIAFHREARWLYFNFMKLHLLLGLSVMLGAAIRIIPAQTVPVPARTGHAQWTNGLPSDPGYFPIAVWLQSPRNAARYKAAGINVYIGLWQGPTTNQLAELDQAGMPVICAQNRAGLAHKSNRTIVGWMHDDEPDNAQSLGSGKGYGPPVKPEIIQRDYERMRAADPTRPVVLNLGQGVAWDNYIGRGVRRNHPEDYPEYIQGCDVVSFDIYPVVHDAPEIAGKLEYVARGVDRLVQWSSNRKIVWNCIECTHISEPGRKANPAQVRAEVWMALIHGSRGLVYFVHQFKPSFKEAALLDDPEMLAAVTAMNQRIRDLAPVLNSPTLAEGARAQSTPENTSIALMLKRRGMDRFLFAVNMRPEPARGSFTILDMDSDSTVEVLDEARHLPLQRGKFTDDFKPYEVHLYRILGGKM